MNLEIYVELTKEVAYELAFARHFSNHRGFSVTGRGGGGEDHPYHPLWFLKNK